MSARKEYLRLRREWLVSKAAAERSEVGYDASHLQKSLRWVDTGFAVGQVLRAHPVLALAGVSLLLRAANAKRLLLAGQLVTAWELFSVVRKQWPRCQI
jgi:hypothetical protein